MANWTIIAHPVARGGRRVGEHAALRLRERGWGVDLVFTARPGDAERLAGDALEAGCRRIAVCGGDGTVHEVVGALAGTDGVLGVVPCGR
ncbi:MAG: acylglycerol kinase family protein, partial [bacterium]|nr:acylglycerol kinase family protein [bacterium]